MRAALSQGAGTGLYPQPASPVQRLSWVWRKKCWTRIEFIGSAKQIKGTVKEVVGKAVGDAKLESEGKADKLEGKVQNVVGGIKDTLKGT